MHPFIRAYKALSSLSFVQFLLRLQTNANQHYVGMISAGIAFYFLMAAFPALGAAISIFGLVADPVLITRQIAMLDRILPPDALKILTDQASAIAGAGHGTLSLSLIVSILFTVYSTTKGANALITGCNIAFNVKERRNFLNLTVTSYLLTLFLVALFLTMLSVVAVIPVVVAWVPLPDMFSPLLIWVRWPMMFLFTLVAISVIYSFAPNQKPKRWQGISMGSLTATVLWVLVSGGFSIYVSSFGKYNQTYGSLGAVIILLLWFWLTAMSLLYGAEVDALRQGRDREPDHKDIPPGK